VAAAGAKDVDPGGGVAASLAVPVRTGLWLLIQTTVKSSKAVNSGQ
jgi:hypothetical protein